MLKRYFGRVRQLIVGAISALAVTGAFAYLQTGSIGLTSEDLPAVAYAVLGMLVLVLLLALFPRLFGPPD